MINPNFDEAPTEEEVARYITGIYASLEIIQTTVESDSTLEDMRPIIWKNHSFISMALSNQSIREAVDNLERLTQSLREALEAYGAKVSAKAAAEAAALAALPKPNPLLAHLEELGL